MSSTLRWMYSTTGNITALSRNGMRQPQSIRASSDTEALTEVKIKVEMMTATGTLVWPNVPANPRRLGPADSVRSSAIPPHWPPAAMPCAKRSRTSRTGARTPTAPALGRQPIRNVASAMPTRQTTTVGLRPYLSPK